MARTFLELVQQAANEIGIPEPSHIIGGQDETSKQLLSLANREGKDFSVLANGCGGWQNLHKEYTFQPAALVTTGTTVDGAYVITGIPSTTGIVAGTWKVTGNGIPYPAAIVSVDSATQVTIDVACDASASGVALTFGQVAYDLPTDFEYFVQKTFWDGAYRWMLLGPISAQEKQILRYGIIASGPRRKFYVRDNKMWLDPIPGESGNVIAYDYFSNNWCQSAAGVDQKFWTADTDVYKLDEDCFVQGLKWRYLRAKGLDYGQEKLDYDNDSQRVMSRDGGARDMPLAGSNFGQHFLDSSNIPETGFGQ